MLILLYFKLHALEQIIMVPLCVRPIIMVTSTVAETGFLSISLPIPAYLYHKLKSKPVANPNPDLNSNPVLLLVFYLDGRKHGTEQRNEM